ncbi:TonB-dependent receptor [Shewanella sp. 1_MG-2023]|uniref:TonB-dependent receptor n=1 Tax=unclassified Shewanella TaxID=196818 RepID=UPI0026E2343A|nr:MULTISPECIES: TonB-dependent receptor [unclassified Shewanella]MDO6612624.1 TonB-dependent receptor [Shewanella sp. 7_MG-2023]MDO6772323.1 TonB-dependent receptor [Shewanella sp. 2_MG-2023]MDO6795306.1 TonB-dependent receptor [Shewanella sp. 1_MG-2023]
MLNNKISRLALATCFAMGVSLPAMAADTASNIRGQIVGPQGNAVTDATITIIHEPTGTVTEVSVGAEGQFLARGLRVGGPYIIKVDSGKFADDIEQDLYLNVGETLRFNRTLQSAADMERIGVVGNASYYRSAGANSEFGAKEIANAPGISRDLKDVLRQNPMAVVGTDGISMSVAGMNPRFNTFVVDGISQNDDFGLNSNGYPTQRSPISIDAVESVALNVSPYTARLGGFTGAQINAVTKSGTNEVSGTVFYEMTNDSMAGEGLTRADEDGVREKVEQKFEEKTFGGTIGFPIIKDKLFFFGSYESFDAPKSAEWGPEGAGFGNNSDITEAELQRVRDAAASIYGLENIGAYDKTPQEEDKKILAKIDWNINDDHRASFTYQNTKGNLTNNLASNSSSIKLSSTWYNKEEILETYAANLYSDWTEDFSTEIKVAYKDTTSNSNTIDDLGIGQVEVQTYWFPNADEPWKSFGSGDKVTFGTDKSRQANELNNQNLEMRFVGDYYLGDHEIGFGVQYNKIEVFNLFAQNVSGNWSFKSIEDFEQAIVDDFFYSNAKSGNPTDVAAEFNMSTLALFAEDTWNINDDLEMTFGLRYETISMSDSPALNDNFVERYGFANNATFDGKDIWLPRIGLTYILSDDVKLRGGVGRYSGGSPTVWMSNSFSNDGNSLLTYDGGWDNAWGTPDFGDVPSDAQDGLVGGDGNTNSLDPDFDLPSDWRASIGFDSTWDFGALGQDWFFGGEFLYIQKENDVAWVDLARREVKTDDSGRVIYETWDPLANNGVGGNTDRYDLMLTNAEEDGTSKTLSFTLAKSWDMGLNMRASYAYNSVDEGNQGSSSTATSNYQYTPVQSDRNGTSMGPGYYETPHRFTVSLGYETEFVAGYASSFNMFYEAREGNPLTWVLGSYKDGGFGDQSAFYGSSYYLPYIPTDADDPLVEYNGLTYEEFKKAIDEIGLSKYAGGIAGKGTSNQPWVHQLDFRFTQELPGFMDGHKGILYFDVKNVLNLMNDDWGRVETQSYGSKKLVDHNYNPETGVYSYSVPYGQDGLETDNYNSYDVNKSTWQLKVGVKYKF